VGWALLGLLEGSPQDVAGGMGVAASLCPGLGGPRDAAMGPGAPS